MARRSWLIKVALGVVAVAGLAVLFVRSAQSTRAEPYDVRRERLQRWTLALEEPAAPSGVLLALRPQREFASTLFSDLFSRTGESITGPVPVQMPLVLRNEIDPRAAAELSADGLVTLARESGMESTIPQPKCMAHRRISAPGVTRQVYFVLFEMPAFGAFRQQLAPRVREAGGTLDPAALSPAVIIAASDARFSDWQPLRGDAQQDCVAPITVH